ncbi:hypothetical protein G3I40_20655 [Streptomyces sp. SID14478]|uniref:hypothetical protein n=1 Tax=Streptomyces sp. SID14478 TaxID=2706073 RepID=UPI0013DAB096|nr:hypothetical protein [Streptomyces sp. SID14478]NEB77605.1 hypothetical protein [Streptomyces sp. SID14478]
MNRIGSLIAASTLLATCAAGLSAAPATAGTAALDTLNCLAGTSKTTYNPPITQTASDTTRTIDQKYSACVGTGAAAGITSGTHKDSNVTNRSCLQLLSTGTVSWTIKWNNGKTSKVTAQRVSEVVGALFQNTFSGKITEGVLAGHNFIEVMTAPSLDITKCTLGQGTVSELNSVHTFVAL